MELIRHIRIFANFSICYEYKNWKVNLCKHILCRKLLVISRVNYVYR